MWRAAQAARCVEIPAPSHEGVLISALERCKVKDKKVKVKYGGLAITGCVIDELALINAPKKNVTLEEVCRAFDLPVSAARELLGSRMQNQRQMSGRYMTRDMVAAK